MTSASVRGRRTRSVVGVAGIAASTMLLAGCAGLPDGLLGGDGEEDDDPGSDGGEGSGGGGGGGDATPEEVEAATVRIEAEGTFVDPEVGEVFNVPGSGSGFLVSPDGLVVTNNHVVTGAALLRVYVGGSDEPVNAQVLGVSECSDLAVIDLDGDGYPSLSWEEGAASTGTDVYAAGFPLGDPEYTLTRGIVSKADADGESTWASVDNVLEHDARINPGNSGGPLVNGDGRVIGVNYAGNAETGQQFAIAAAEAVPVVEQLRESQNVTSIGINGTAVLADDESFSGIWVSSVESGSPADAAGVEPGDVVTQIEDILVATDGTMSDYCDVLRSNTPEDVLQIEVLRFETGEILEGQINGDPLEPSTVFAQELEGEAEDNTGGEGGAAGGEYTEYVSITDDTGAVAVDIPAEWVDVDGRPFTGQDGIDRIDVRAATDLQGFGDSWLVPGMILTASSQLAQVQDEEAVLDTFVEPLSGQCSYVGREPYADALYTGFFDLYDSCGGTNTLYLVVAAVPPERNFIVYVQVQVPADRDLAAADRILDTFVVTGNV